MLEITQITKTYEIGNKKSKNYQTVQALNGLTIGFRQSEFVSILGPSGCGKTTLLNILGGLDKYTSGDLIINGVSTKQFKDKDWDNYRNHSVGFVFQSYNLISHQTILQNVELALTLSGVKKAERHNRALEALDKVGLKDRAHNKPNQLSGGQMQRVAIARAIVNDPDIILADEPTGALDSKTSVQIMEILKELSKDRLVVMVTHNPELAKTYSSRIITLKDGELISDTNPYQTGAENTVMEIDNTQQAPNTALQTKRNDKPANIKNVKQPKKRMSFFTALGLSFNNLLTKKARTILVAFAGSIGIIGIALILAVSSGFNNYMNKIQEDTLSSYPIVIEEQSFDYMSMMSSMFSSNEQIDHDKDAVYPNDTLSSIFDSFASGMKTNDMGAFNKYMQDNYSKLEPYVTAIKYTYDLDLHIYNSNDSNFDKPLSPGNSSLYELIIKYTVSYIADKTQVAVDYTADGIQLTKTPNTDLQFLERFIAFSPDIKTIYTNLNTTGSHLLTEVEITSIIKTVFMMDISIYKSMDLGLFNEMIDNEQFIKSQYNLLYGEWNKEDIYKIDGKDYTDALLVLDKNNELDDYLLYALGFISDEQINNLFNAKLKQEEYEIKINYADIVGKTFKVYVASDTYQLSSDETSYVQTADKKPSEANKDNYLNVRISGIVKVNDNSNGGALDEGLAYSKALTDYCINKYNSSAPVNTAENVVGLLPIDKSSPRKIAIYANSFAMKDVVEQFISDYNAGVGDDQKITYTDYIGLMMNTVSSIMNTVTYVLIAFVSVSLIVSSIMIGVITYISVLERIKEIGVLRSVGASKQDVKRVFTAESLIIGFTAGALGIIVTLLLCIPINIIFKNIAAISNLATLPVAGGIILVLISMLLTFISGLIPARVASKKDPVIALRTE